MQAKMVVLGCFLGISIGSCGGAAPPAAQVQPAAPPTDDDAPRTADQAIAHMSKFRDDMCKCSTKQCADDVIALVNRWGQRMANTPPPVKITEDDTRRMAEVVEDLTACMTATQTTGATSTRAATAPSDPGGPQNIAPTALDANRIAGNKLIVPDNDVKRAFASSGKSKLVTSYKVCVDVGGSVTEVSVLKPSGYASYDAQIVREIGAWRYRPFRVNGAVAAVCTAVTFIYSQQGPPPPPARP